MQRQAASQATFSEMPRVFLSHVRSDRAQARRLAEVLRQSGYTPWLAEDEARVGEPFAETLSRGLRDTQAVVVLLSRASVESAWTSTEVSLLRGHAREPHRLYVVRLERVTPPAEVSEERALDLFPGETAWQSGVKRLLHVLGKTTVDLPGDNSASLPPHNLPPRAAPFVGREQELVALHERLMTMPVGGSVLLTGPRGVGKTALAVEYATRYAADHPGGLWWVPAQLGPRRALAWILKDVAYSPIHSMRNRLFYVEPAASTEELARGVLEALQASPKPSLLILDDVKGAGWRHFLPSGHVRVLATSRSPSFVKLKSIQVQPLRALSREDFEALFTAMSPHEDMHLQVARDSVLDHQLRESPLLTTLIARLQAHSPTAWNRLEHASGQLAPKKTWMGSRAENAALENAVLDTCIEQFPADALTRRLLEASAFFAPDIELDARLLWSAASGQESLYQDMPMEAFDALDALGRSGLLQVWGEGVPFSRMHRVILRRVRALMPTATWERAAQVALASALEWARDAEQYGDLDFERLRPHLEAVLRATASLVGSREWMGTAEVLARCLARRDEQLAAKTLWKQALRRAEQALSHEVELVATLRAGLASAHEALGNTSAAQRHLERAVADNASSPGGDAAKKAQRLADLARLQLATHKSMAALESIDHALALASGTPAESAPQFPMQLYLRARILQSLGRREEAHEVLEKALLTGEQLAVGRYATLAPIMEALADSRREQHDESGAITLLERVIDEDQRILGEAHFETVVHLTELARTYAEFDRRAQTRTTVDRILPLLDRALAPTDSRKGELLLKLAESLLRVDENEQAHQLLERVLDVEAAQAAPDFNRLFRLVMAFLLSSDKALDVGTSLLFERVLSLTRRERPSHSVGARRLSKLLDSILKATEPAAPPTPLSPIQTPSPGAGAESLERALRLARRSQVRDEVKAEALREALTAAQQGDDPANGARACLLLADLEGRSGAWEQARAHAQQGLQLALRAGLPSLVAEGYRVLGDTALHGSFYEEARMSYEEAIRRYDSLGDTGPTARTRTLLVTLLMQLGHLNGLEDHVRWLDEHQQHPSLTEDDRKDVRAVLTLAGDRLSSLAPGARHPRS